MSKELVGRLIRAHPWHLGCRPGPSLGCVEGEHWVCIHAPDLLLLQASLQSWEQRYVLCAWGCHWCLSLSTSLQNVCSTCSFSALVRTGGKAVVDFFLPPTMVSTSGRGLTATRVPCLGWVGVLPLDSRGLLLPSGL